MFIGFCVCSFEKCLNTTAGFIHVFKHISGNEQGCINIPVQTLRMNIEPWPKAPALVAAPAASEVANVVPGVLPRTDGAADAPLLGGFKADRVGAGDRATLQ